MSDRAIKVEGLGKRYRIGANLQTYRTLKDRLNASATAPFRAAMHLLTRNGDGNGKGPNGTSKEPRARRQEVGDDASPLALSSLRSSRASREMIWALRDVSFEIKQGEVVGIIGRNGAGKSTLLKILSRITEPTEGYADIYGRVASLLEVGTGFQPELTGRENIFLNGSILGMKRAEIKKKFDEIVDFSEVEKFIDTPVKYYSSGMYVRLAFGVAAHLNPEILLVDEVLAVGDAAFQKKCLGKMGDVAKAGRTVLFVSHNMAAVENLCSRGVLFDRGRIRNDGEIRMCITDYLKSAASSDDADVDLSSHPARDENAKPLLRRVRLLDGNDQVNNLFHCGERMRVEFTFEPLTGLRDPQFGIGVNDWMGTRIFSTTTYFSESSPAVDNRKKIVCEIESLPLAPGRYTLCLSVGTMESLLIDNLENAVSFEVASVDFYGNGRVPEPSFGRVLVRSRWIAAD
jgi:lipopolysaccharide transport system ATP-binding protein